MTSSRWLGIGVLAVTLLANHAYAAGPSAADLETARVLYKEGRDLRAKGDLKGAYTKLLAAHSLGHTPLTGLELAKVEVDLGMLVEAREVCLSIARMPVESDETKRSAEARDEAAKTAEALKPRIPAITIRITPVPTKAELIVDVDGARVPAEALGEPRRVNPGDHQLHAHYAGGDTVSVTVTVREAETKEAALAPPAPLLVDAPPPPPPPPVVPPPPRRAGVPALAVAGLVTASVGLVLGGAGGIAAIALKNQLKCGGGTPCSGSDADTLDDANIAANVSNVGFVLAGVGAVLTVIGFVTAPSRTAPAAQRSITPDVGLGWLGVHGRF
jgi:hypothetical protein